ncbi:MAG: hypothetical protein DHS20C19_05190 [Acidimicrobiales bacterium]|nr:MAG: hypothetical protein DHS20C19_05190 [Acidimicrobiales bacterium]
MVHVGYPIARERDTERGIRAAMAALAHSRDAAAAVVVQHVVVAAPGESDSEIATEIDGASRTEANSLIEQAAAGEILVSPSVAEVVEGHVELQKREDRHVAVGVRPVAAVARPAMLHGRDAELARVAELVDGAVQGRGSVVVVAGDAGIGKTVFIDDIARRFPGAVYRATGSPFHVATPLWPIARLFEGVPLENLPPVVAGWVERGEEALADIADPEERRAVIFDAIVDFALGADAPALWVFDDAHQLDATTRELVETLATSVGREPVLVAVLVRGVAEEHIDGLADANHLRLGPLDDKAVADIVRSASPHELSGSAVATLVARADGVPLFAAELARSWDGRGAELAGTADAEAVPIPLHGLFQARLDAAGVDRALLQAAAVLGDDFDRELLASVSAVAGVDTGLEALCGAGILTRRRRAGRVRYRFRHALIGEAAYAAVPAMRRADLHGRVVDAAAEHGIDDVEWVSLHLERAERWSDAIVMGSRAAQRSLELSAVTETLSLTERGLALVAKLESPGAEVEEAIGALWLARGVALVIREGPSGPGVRALYEYVDTELPTPLTPMQRFAARWGHWYAVSAGDRPAEALRLARAVHEAAVASGDPALLIEGHHVMWSSLLLAGEFEAVLAHTAEAITLYDADEHHWLTHAYGGHDPGVCMHSTAGLALWMLGDRDRARPRLLEALALADRIGHPYSRLEASFGPMAVAVLEEDGDFLQGEADALDAVSESGLLPVSAGGYVAGCRGVARVISDDRAGGIDQLRAAAGEWAELWGDYCLPFDTALALALIDAGGAEEALAHLDARWDPVEGSRWWDGEFLRVRGLARLAVGDVDGQADIERAADIAARQGAVGLARRAEADLAGPRA